MPKPGDKVTFHMIPVHLCVSSDDVKEKRVKKGLSEEPSDKGCKCDVEAQAELDAKVVTVHPLEKNRPQALELEVDMPPEVLALGYAPRQSYSYEATTFPPESGTWTAS